MNETANEIKRLQGCINDLIGVLALPALWKGQDEKQIIKTLLDVLVATLRLDFAYVRLNDPVGGGPIEMVGHDQLRDLAAEPGLVGQTLTQSLGTNPRNWPPRAKNPFGKGSLAIVPLGSGRDDEVGVIVAGSDRADFPWQTETVVLSVAANQAAMGLASVRAYEQERLRERLRSDAELEREKLRASEERLIETSRLYRELQNREGKIRRLVDANIVGIFIWDLEGRILEANDAFLTTVGYDRDDLVSPGLRWTDLTPPEWRERDERLVPELKMAGALQPFEKEYFRKDGTRVPVLIGVATFEETVNRGVAFVLDLTQRKRAEEALLSSERNLRLMLDTVPINIQMLRPDGSLLYANQGVLDYMGITLEDAQKEDYRARFFHPEDIERLREERREALTHAVPFENEQRVLRKDGTYRWFLVRYSPLLNEQGGIDRWYVVGTDIEDRKQAEARIRRLVDADIIGIFVGDLEGRIVEANDAFLRIIGYDREELVSKSLNWIELTPPEWRERNMRAVAELTSTGTTRPFEKEYFRKDGSRVPVLIGAALVQEGGREGVVFVLDLTERKRTEEALRQLESNLAHMNRVSMMGELAASLAHEITQPIGSARNNARTAQNFLKMQPPEPNEVHAALDRLIGNVDRATEIIDRIRDNIKKAPPRNERFDLNATINEVIALAQNVIVRNGVSVHIGLADGSLLVQGDRVQLQQVVLNLILNAVEAMGPAHAGGRNLFVSTEREDTGVRVAVRDSGPGIDRRKLERVFESFYTTKPGGTGMGLSVSRSIVDAYGGRLWAEVNEPQGAVFQFTWPGAEVGL